MKHFSKCMNTSKEIAEGEWEILSLYCIYINCTQKVFFKCQPFTKGLSRRDIYKSFDATH